MTANDPPSLYPPALILSRLGTLMTTGLPFSITAPRLPEGLIPLNG